MHRTNGDGFLDIGGKHYYQDENPPVNDATQLRHEEMNAIQEEICNVIEGEDLSLNSSTETYSQMNQLDAALWKRNAKLSPRMMNGLFASGKYDASSDGFKVYEGSCIDHSGGYFMKNTYPGTFSKNGVSPWTPGAGGNGVPSALSVSQDTWYYVFCIMKVSTGEVDFGIDTSKSANNLLAESGYNVYRMIGIVEAQAGGSPWKFTSQNYAPIGDWIYPTRNAVIMTGQSLVSQTNLVNVYAPPTICEAKLYVEFYNSVAGAFVVRVGTGGDTDLTDTKSIMKISGGDGETIRLQMTAKTDTDGKVIMGWRTGDTGGGTVQVNINRIAFKVDPFGVSDNPLYTS